MRTICQRADAGVFCQSIADICTDVYINFWPGTKRLRRSVEVEHTRNPRLHKDDSGFFIDATLDAELKGVDQPQAELLVAKAHTICPYSKATRGNIEVKLLANGKPVQGG